MSRDIDAGADLIDVRDLIERYEEIEDVPAGDVAATERDDIQALLANLRGNGGDHQWRGDWYPVTLIRDSRFIGYAQELAEDIGAIPKDAGWPSHCIDWEQAADELRMDYTSAEYAGVTYWFR